MTFLSLQNIFQYFTVAGFINAIVLSVLLAINKKNHLAKIYMIALVLIITFQAILNAFDNQEFFMTYPHLSKISWLIPSLFGSLVFLFTIKLCDPYPRFHMKDLLHFIPAVLYFIFLIPWFMKSAEEKRLYFMNFKEASRDDFGFLNQLSIFLILAYITATLWFLRKFRKSVNDTFSETSHKKIEWMNTFIYCVLIVLIISSFGFFGYKWHIPVLHFIYHYNYILVVILVYWIAYKALLQPVIFEFPEPETKSAKKYEKSGLNEEQAEILFNRLVERMKKDKPYLDPELNIFQLAELLQVKKHHLSQVINEKTAMNFFDFINSFRVEEIKKNLQNGHAENLTLLGIAFDSGFNSKATFNSSFKKFTGQTPSDFQKSLKNIVRL